METENNIIVTEIADLWMDSQQIIHIRFHESQQHGLAEAVEIVRAHNRLADGVRTPVLADLREVKVGANREARSHYVSDESAEFKSGMAMLVSSSMQRMVGNIFLKLNRPPYPTRLFREETAAVQWLKQLSEDG